MCAVAEEKKYRLKDVIDWARRIHWLWTLFPAGWKAYLIALMIGTIGAILARLNRVTPAQWWIYFLAGGGIYVIVWLLVQQRFAPKATDGELPAIRPYIVLTRCDDKPDVTGYYGVYYANDGEKTGYDVEFGNAKLGSSTLTFSRVKSRLTPHEEAFCHTAIEQASGSGLLGGLFNEMVRENVTGFDVSIKYNDGNHPHPQWYETICHVERDVEVRFIFQCRQQKIKPRTSTMPTSAA
jgi:hypothetical protein